VLNYGCQLWFTGKQKKLIKKLQVIQNEAIRVISGAFRTSPREQLHQLLSILPVDLRLTMLTQNTAGYQRIGTRHNRTTSLSPLQIAAGLTPRSVRLQREPPPKAREWAHSQTYRASPPGMAEYNGSRNRKTGTTLKPPELSQASAKRAERPTSSATVPSRIKIVKMATIRGRVSSHLSLRTQMEAHRKNLRRDGNRERCRPPLHYPSFRRTY